MTPQHAESAPRHLCGHIRRRLYAIHCWTVFIVILLSFGFLIVVWPGSRSQRRVIARAGARALIWLARMPFDIVGLEHLPERTHVLISNHSSFLDALILTAALPASPGYAFVARQEYRSQVLLWPLLRALGTVILHEHTAAAPSNVRRLMSALQDGQNLIVFPEGAIRRSSGIRPFHTGAFIAARQAGVPIVLAGIAGARQALRLKTWLPLRTRISVTIGDVIEPVSSDEEVLLRTIAMAGERIAALAGEELIPEAVREP